MEGHLNAVGVIDLLTDVFFTVMGVLVSLGVLLFGAWINGEALWQQEGGIVALAVMLSVSGVFLSSASRPWWPASVYSSTSAGHASWPSFWVSWPWPAFRSVQTLASTLCGY